MNAWLPSGCAMRRRNASTHGSFRPARRQAHRTASLAREALQHDELDSAERLAMQALLAHPGSPEVLALLATVLDRRGETSAAWQCRRGVLPESLCNSYLGVLPGSCDAPEVERQVLTAPESHPLPVPGALPGDPAYPWSTTRIEARPAVIDTLGEGYLWYDGFNSLAFDHARRPHRRGGIGSTALIEALIQHATPRSIPHRVFMIGARSSGNYYHWMFDVLPRLELLIRAGYRFGANDRFVLPHIHHPFQRQSLALYGISKRQLILTSRSTPWLQATTLVVPQIDNRMGLAMAAWVPQSLESRLGGRPDATIGGTRRLFVARHPRQAQGRALENHAAIAGLLEHAGFECLYPERLSVREQAQVFASARLIVAPHGAALANIVHCSPDTTVLEAHGAHLAPCYWAISALKGLDYYHLPAADHSVVDDPYERARTRDARRMRGFSIDASRLFALLEQIDIRRP